MWEEGGRGGERDKVLPVVTISFCWDTREHPDPQVGQGRNTAPRGATPLAGKLKVSEATPGTTSMTSRLPVLLGLSSLMDATEILAWAPPQGFIPFRFGVSWRRPLCD